MSVTETHRRKEWKGGSKYNKTNVIGKGAFATVYKVTTKFSGDPYAAKELEKRRFMKNGILNQKVDMEMTIMRKIRHVRTSPHHSELC
jgi:serine/threonine protein kinase